MTNVRIHFVLVAAFVSAHSWPCPIATNGSKVSLTGERALIIWNPTKKMQHVVREALFESETREFGFVVPTPSLPEMAQVEPEVFSELSAYVAPFLLLREGRKTRLPVSSLPSDATLTVLQDGRLPARCDYDLVFVSSQEPVQWLLARALKGQATTPTVAL